MKTSIKTLIVALTLGTSAAFAAEDKAKSDTNTLPAQSTVIETPAPQTNKTVNEYTKYSPAQKAALVELKLAK